MKRMRHGAGRTPPGWLVAGLGVGLAVASSFVLGPVAHAGDARRARSPLEAVVALKNASESREEGAIVARYAEPGASAVGSRVAATARLDAASAALTSALVARPTLAAKVEDVLSDLPRTPLSPLVGATVVLVPGETRQKGDRATARVRVATRDVERFFRFSFVLVAGDWKVVLTSIDGVPVEGPWLVELAAQTRAREGLADEVAGLARDVAAGVVTTEDTVRRRIAAAVERERAALREAAATRRAATKEARIDDDDL